MEQALWLDVKTYGFLHVGIEPLRREVLKRTWALLAGNTLYGVIQGALMRLDGPLGQKPARLLDALCRPTDAGGPALRFMPLLPDNRGTIKRAWDYCIQATRLADLERGTLVRDAFDRGYQTTPHAPLNRRNAQIHGSQLFAIECHQPEQRYRGWILCEKDLVPLLEEALTMLPFLPLGGKGKFTVAEATVLDCLETSTLRTQLIQDANAAQPAQGADSPAPLIEVEMVTPLVFQGVDLGIIQGAQRWQPKPPRRYRVWRAGDYPDITRGGRHFFGRRLPTTLPTAARPPMAWLPESTGYTFGETSQAVPALPDGSRFGFTPAHTAALADAFFTGVGRADWAALGWGQLFFRQPTARENSKEHAHGETPSQ